MATTYHVRPSALAGLEPRSPEAWCLDQAVSIFGNALSDELDSVEGKNKAVVRAQRQHILDKWLTPVSGDEADSVPKGSFADPALRFKE